MTNALKQKTILQQNTMQFIAAKPAITLLTAPGEHMAQQGYTGGLLCL